MIERIFKDSVGLLSDMNRKPTSGNLLMVGILLKITLKTI